MALLYSGAPANERYDSFTGRFATGMSFTGWFLTPAVWPVNPYVFSNQTNFFMYFANVGGGAVALGLEQDFVGGYAEYQFPLPAVSTQLHIAVRWDMSDGANLPRAWYNGVEQTLISSIPRSGLPVAGTAVFRWHGATFSTTQAAAYTAQDIVVWDDALPSVALLAANAGVSLSNYRRDTQVFNLNELTVVEDRSPNGHPMTQAGTVPAVVNNFRGVNRPRRR